MEKGVLLNQILKVPTRILIRLKSFKCRDLPKLFKKIKNIDWSPFLTKTPESIKISCHQSRLFHTDKIEKTFVKALDDYFRGFPPKKKFIDSAKNFPPVSVFIRFENDTCTISLDTSGDPLYKRNKRPFNGKAPIRENYGAALCYSLKKEIDLLNEKKKGSDFHLIDPMCGSGTFLLESTDWFKPNQIRKFSYYSYPCFNLTPPSVSFSSKENESKENNFSLFATAQGYETSEKVLEKTQESNLKANLILIFLNMTSFLMKKLKTSLRNKKL